MFQMSHIRFMKEFL